VPSLPGPRPPPQLSARTKRSTLGSAGRPVREAGGREVDSHILTCRGMLSLHRDSAVTCSNSTCPTSRISDLALGTHSYFVMCHEPHCADCATAEERVR
jgi:hypothetical protein